MHQHGSELTISQPSCVNGPPVFIPAKKVDAVRLDESSAPRPVPCGNEKAITMTNARDKGDQKD
jgi:hypothetical protein